MKSSAALTEKRYVVPFILVTSLFFLWAIGVNINDILIQHLKKAFNLTDFQSSRVPMAFFGGYFLAALPAGWLMQRLGYKRGILIGLLTCAAGAFLFIPAASIGVYGFFLFALFLMACGQSFLEVAANPYVTILGPPETAERRINLSQSFNAAGAVTIVLLGSTFILSGIEHTSTEFAAMTSQQLAAYQASEANMVKVPYLIITALFLLVAVVIHFSKLPEISTSENAVPSTESPGLRMLWSRTHLIKGIVAQFLYVGAQVGVTGFFIRFVEHTMPGTTEKSAAHYLQLHLIGFLVGRFSARSQTARNICRRLSVMSSHRPGWLGPCPGLGNGAARLLPLHYVSYNFRIGPERPRPLHQTWIFTAGDGHYWRRGRPGHHGKNL